MRPQILPTCRAAQRTRILLGMKRLLEIALFLCLSLAMAAQTPSSYRIKSWKTGTAQAEAQTLKIALSATERVYSKSINDASGHPLYRLLVEPAAFIGPGDGVVAWHVYLTTANSNDNLLLPSKSLQQEEYEGPDYLWWFYPGNNRLVPIDATRVAQVEGSYVTLKAEDVKVNGLGQLENMQLTIIFSNTPPEG